MAKILITGATGFLGSNLTRRLAEQGHNITILVRNGSDHPFFEKLRINRVAGDVTDFDSLKNAMRGIDVVYHCAGIVSYRRSDAGLMDVVNIGGTDNACRAALESGVERFLYVSSTAAVGIPESPEHPADERYPFHKKWLRIPYMRSKKAAEEKALSFVERGLNIVSVNPSTFYGAGDIKVSTGDIFRKINAGILKSAPPGGNGVIAIDDCVEGIIRTAEKGKTGERYILNGENLPFLEIFNTIARVLHKPPINKIMPRWLLGPAVGIAAAMGAVFPVIGADPPISTELIKISWSHRYFDASKAAKELGWTPKISLEQACCEAVDFYKAINAL